MTAANSMQKALGALDRPGLAAVLASLSSENRLVTQGRSEGIPKGKPPAARLGGLAAVLALRTARCGPCVSRRRRAPGIGDSRAHGSRRGQPAPSSPTPVLTAIGHRASAEDTTDTGGIGRGRSLDPSRATQARDRRERAQRAPDGEPSAARRAKSSDLGLPRLQHGWVTSWSVPHKLLRSTTRFS